MPTVNWPTLTRKPTRQTWELRALTQVHESPLTGSVQTQELPGSRWASSIVYDNVVEPADKAALMALAAGLRGRAGRVAVRLWNARARGNINGFVLVNGANQTGATLSTDGWAAGSGSVAVGDYFSVNGELKMITAAATASGAGAITIAFEPPLRQAPADNAALVFDAPTVTMMPISDAQNWTYEAGGVMSFAFDLVEVL
jgi:hypothetical protein